MLLGSHSALPGGQCIDGSRGICSFADSLSPITRLSMHALLLMGHRANQTIFVSGTDPAVPGEV